MKVCKISLLSLFLFLLVSKVFAGEGMWLPFLLKQLNEKEMKAMGMKMSAEDIYSINKGSLKDAIAHFGGGCTSEIISPNGLLLTNHHCGYGYIQEHSSLEHNYLEEGFWAMNRQEEIPCSGLTVTLISRMEDVTNDALAGVTDEMTASERQSAIDKNINSIKENADIATHEEVTVKPFFEGNQYIMIVTVTYSDIRMVGAPPSSIGSFGADTDNWVWPRHSGDFSLFRIYAGADNLPADYSENNVPFKPKHFLPVSMDGIEEGDFTLVFGFPGRTDEYLPSFAVEQVVDVLDPARIGIRDIALKIVGTAMREDAQVKIQYASKYARIANYWKKWQGEVLGLKATNAVEKKKMYEKEFSQKIDANREWNQKYGNLMDDFDRLYAEVEPYALVREYYYEVCLRNTELMGLATMLHSWVQTYKSSGDQAFLDKKERVLDRMRGFFKDYNAEVDQKVFAGLMEKYVRDIDEKYQPPFLKEELQLCSGNFDVLSQRFYNYTLLLDTTKIFPAIKIAPAKDIVAILEMDRAYQLAAQFASMYKENVAPTYESLNTQINELQRKYMKAQMLAFPDKTFYPDANGTLRVTYGKVQGYEPKDAIRYYHLTCLDGVMEKYVPGDYEFDVHPKLRELYEKKDYGPYGEGDCMPVCFIGSNHTTGGNSGSPAIDAHGNLIGLNFDRVWEGTMSDINYDISLCRNIMVDMRYVLFIIDKFAGAKHLIDEMKLVHPKKK